MPYYPRAADDEAYEADPNQDPLAERLAYMGELAKSGDFRDMIRFQECARWMKSAAMLEVREKYAHFKGGDER